MMIFNKDKLISILVFFFAYIITFYILPFHVAGDQIHYSNAYFAVKDLNLSDALKGYRTFLHTGELGHFIITYIYSFLGLDRIFLICFLNALLAVLFYSFLRSRGWGFLFSIFLVITNYYMYSVFFTLERLKVAFIFLLFFYHYRNHLF